MLKMKIEKMNYQMFIENTFCDYLTAKAKEGWFFKRVLGEFLIFKKGEPQEIKYQLEFGLTDYDYDDYLKDVGYEFVFAIRNITIYKNEDLNAPDLHTDDSVRFLAMENMYFKHPIALFLALALCFIPGYMILSLLLLEPLTLGMIIRNIRVFIVIGLYCVGFVGCLFMMMQSVELKRIIKKATNNEQYSFKIINLISKANTVMLMFLFAYLVSGVGLILSGLFHNFNAMVLTILRVSLLCAIVCGLAKIMLKYRIEKRFITGAVIMTAVLLHLAFDSVLYIPVKTNPAPMPLVDAYMSDYNYSANSKEIFYTYQAYSKEKEGVWRSEAFENYKVCLNTFIAKELMKDDIVSNERSARETEEFKQSMMDQYGSYSSKDLPYKSYKDALATLTVYKHELIDECYYNEHFFVARKDNKVLVSYMQDEDNYISNVIEHYFK